MGKKILNRLDDLVWDKRRADKQEYTLAEIRDETGLSLNTVKLWLGNRYIKRFDSHVVLAWCTWLECDMWDILYLGDDNGR